MTAPIAQASFARRHLLTCEELTAGEISALLDLADKARKKAECEAREKATKEDKKDEEDGAEAMTAAALVARAFEGAVEVRPRTSTQTFPLASPASFFSLLRCYTQLPRPHTMSRRSFHAARTTRRGAPLAQFSARPAAPSCLMPADSPRSAGA